MTDPNPPETAPVAEDPDEPRLPSRLAVIILGIVMLLASSTWLSCQELMHSTSEPDPQIAPEEAPTVQDDR